MLYKMLALAAAVLLVPSARPGRLSVPARMHEARAAAVLSAPGRTAPLPAPTAAGPAYASPAPAAAAHAAVLAGERAAAPSARASAESALQDAGAAMDGRERLLVVDLQDSPLVTLWTRSYRRHVVSSFRRRFPEGDVRVVQDYDAGKLREKLARELAPGEEVSHLWLRAHGAWEGEPGATRTWLVRLGRFDAAGPDAELSAFLEPLRGRLRDGAHLTLHACSVLGGPVHDAAARAAGLMRWLGARDWSLYGPSVGEFSAPGLFSREFVRNWAIFTATAVLVPILLLSVYAVAAAALTGELKPDWAALAGMGLLKGVGGMGAIAAVAFAAIAAVNRGVLLSARGGALLARKVRRDGASARSVLGLD